MVLVAAIGQTALEGVINDYAVVENLDFCESTLEVSDSDGFQPGDKALLIQMQGALIDPSNTAVYGSIAQWGSAGLMEKVEIAAVADNQITLTHWVIQDYDPEGRVQLVRLPVYENAVVTDTLKALPWNGSIGGVLALEVTGVISLNAPVDVSGQGFRGGLSESILPNDCSWLFQLSDYVYPDFDWRSARKGEGIAINASETAAGRGPQANGGGGGNDHNSGGGGGGNGGSGGQGGINDEPATFGCDGHFPGLGGKPAVDPNNWRLHPGGGGGAGHSNNGLGSSGGNGGGIVVITAHQIDGTDAPRILANGATPTMAAGDGGGGGGAGGTILLLANEIDVNILLEARGGNGSDVNNQTNERCFGPGGGGSGGVIGTDQIQLVNTLTEGGTPGQTTNSTNSCNGSNMEATAGEEGFVYATDPLPEGTMIAGPPSIDQQPYLDTLCLGDAATLEVVASGLDPTYQWEIDQGNGFEAIVDGVDFEGAQSAVLQLNGANTNLAGSAIRCVVSSVCGEDAVSEEVLLEILLPPVSSFEAVIDGADVQFVNTSTGVGNFSWNFGDSQFSSEINPMHSFAQSGTYIVVLTAENDCGLSQFFDTLVIETVSTIDPEQDDYWRVFPNPVNEMLVIGSGVVKGDVTIQLYSLNGSRVLLQRIHFEHLHQIDLSMLPAGVYGLTLTDAQSTVVYKVVVR